jgi:hypothetical protein
MATKEEFGSVVVVWTPAEATQIVSFSCSLENPGLDVGGQGLHWKEARHYFSGIQAERQRLK